MQSKAQTVEEYLASLSDERRASLQLVREVVLAHLPKGMEEGMQYGMIGYYVPHSIYPKGYHCDPKQPLNYAGLAAQKNHMSLYLMGIYGSPELRREFEEAFAQSGKKLDMGAACLRFKSSDDLPLDVVGQAIGRLTTEQYIAACESMLASRKGGKK